MLGLGSSLVNGSVVDALPSIDSLSFGLNFFVATTADTGTGILSAATTSIGDLRLSPNIGEYTGTASDYKVTKIEIRNNTVNSGGAFTTVFSGELTMDSVVDQGGGGILFTLFDNNSAMDNIDLGSSSGHAEAHNGTGSNSFFFKATVQLEGYVGSKVIIRSNMSLTDSDA
tara:strand:+ start:2106 stop:2618 length:513 start_codon:yes stop_codon:yes gene_type:complete